MPLPICTIQNIPHCSSNKLLIYAFPLFLTGLERGLEGINAGGKRVITIPSKLGYGSKGSGEDIPPNLDLVFEVKVLKVG
jgi:FKBP-type peptidyl-prolyl cis-trans isomerase